ncbi:MAG: tRNA lysidine(34) synthetase TilS [Clostridia bacterium]|nr:tRNA lysidine(34) synthetase TilS [Clostridia bacterium]
MKTNTLIVKNKALSAIKDYSMLDGAAHVVIGLSGGADSLCLLHLLDSIKGELGFTLSAAHVNHGIRGDEAIRDADFCRSACEELGVQFNLLEADCVALAERDGLTLEECGRNVRYDYFNSLCKDSTYIIATAHNANDNAETLLFNVARGTGLRGACGIPRVRGNVIRPLIYCSRDEIEGYCIENDLHYVTDSTNLCDDYTRNKIRHNALPVLAEVNSGAIKNITTFTEGVADALDYICDGARSLAKAAELGNGYYDAQLLISAHRAVRNECIVALFGQVSDLTIDRQKVNAVADLLISKGRTQIYGNVFAECIKNRFRFFINELSTGDDRLAVDPVTPATLTFNGYTIRVAEYKNNFKKVNKNILDNLIDCDKIVGNLWLRTRAEGDKFTFADRKVTKSLKKLFNELAIPVEERDKIPVLCDDVGVVWIYSIGTDSRCRITDYSSNIISFGGETND